MNTDVEQFKANKSLPIDSECVTTGVTFNGNSCAGEDPDCLAKKVHDTYLNKSGFYVKANPYGFYDPLTEEKAKLSSYDKMQDRVAYDFKLVPEESFDLYCTYLQNGQIAYLREAERKAY